MQMKGLRFADKWTSSNNFTHNNFVICILRIIFEKTVHQYK
jgi:hypothetical protein